MVRLGQGFIDRFGVLRLSLCEPERRTAQPFPGKRNEAKYTWFRVLAKSSNWRRRQPV